MTRFRVHDPSVSVFAGSVCNLYQAFLHREELAVGPRLLCYVSRLAEGLEPFPSWNSGLTVVTGVSEVDKPGKVSEEGVLKNSSRSNRRNTLIDGDEKVTSNSGNSSQEHRISGGGVSVTGNHETNTNLEVNFRKPHSTDSGMQISVVNAFKAYEDFLEQLCGINPSSRSEGLNVALNQKPKMSSSPSFEKKNSLPLESDTSVARICKNLTQRPQMHFLLKI
ncbi:uncharacterized protein [Physcomitrium patens]|uniref:Uncharacterized protein n=1 Tax=Physcomitrium patens TaxID=3218 RepID=A0A2K1IAQ5_PHYPA|nr:hypothetical protein PHYPA_030938 [Physcomitrium patens]